MLNITQAKLGWYMFQLNNAQAGLDSATSVRHLKAWLGLKHICACVDWSHGLWPRACTNLVRVGCFTWRQPQVSNEHELGKSDKTRLDIKARFDIFGALICWFNWRSFYPRPSGIGTVVWKNTKWLCWFAVPWPYFLGIRRDHRDPEASSIAMVWSTLYHVAASGWEDPSEACGFGRTLGRWKLGGGLSTGWYLLQN